MIYRYIIVIKMKPCMNLDKKDPKICLLTKILKYCHCLILSCFSCDYMVMSSSVMGMFSSS